VECSDLIIRLESSIPDPHRGLPEDVFLFLSRITPLINVDLLIKDEKNRTLLTWRDDGFPPPGWHVPGGIIRFQETAATRIVEVAKQELGAGVEFDSVPCAINEVIHPTRKIRGHFISLLYRCRLVTPPDENRRHRMGNPSPEFWMWHETYPLNMIPVHEMYRPFF
jgi:ADP-ribose pyrophosphatase YjhB (NUDIX family)